ncbi:PHP domain-containing protein [Chlamydiota bacterium]
MNASFIDLHIHTNCSDGTFAPEKVIEIAHDKGLSAIAITDHDTIDAIAPAIQFSHKFGIEVIPGIELSAYDESLEVHILGYFIDYNKAWLNEKLSDIREVRRKRFEEIINKLTHFGIVLKKTTINLDKNISYGRPHIAQLLFNEGHVSCIQEAFKKYLGNDCPCYVEKKRLSIADAIEIIRHAHGIPVLAHPGVLKNDANISHYIEKGIRGIEIYHSEHSKSDEQKYLQIAHDNNLLITGGSDCHGHCKPEVLIGKTKLPYSFLERLKEEHLK